MTAWAVARKTDTAATARSRCLATTTTPTTAKREMGRHTGAVPRSMTTATRMVAAACPTTTGPRASVRAATVAQMPATSRRAAL